MWLKLQNGGYLCITGRDLGVGWKQVFRVKTWEVHVLSDNSNVVEVLYSMDSKEEGYEKLDKVMDLIARAKTCVIDLNDLHRAHVI